MTLYYFFSNMEQATLSDVPHERSALQDIPKDTGLYAAEIFFVDARDPLYAKKICRALRSHSIPAVYLKPVVLIGAEDEKITAWPLGDRVLSESRLSEEAINDLRVDLSPCLKRISQLLEKDSLPDTNPAFKILRHMFVRQQELVPLRSFHAFQGYVYPLISGFLADGDRSVFRILEFMESQGLLTPTFVDKSYLCSNCSCAFLNFREACTSCRSINLQVDDLIHHFPCAHVGPQSDFYDGGRLICPKCDKELKHIGVDYDKPSIIYVCNECGNEFQEPDVTCCCHNCGKEAPPEEMHQQVINGYQLTALGANAALYGLESLFRNVLSEKIHVVPLDIFKRFLDIEGERIRRYGKSVTTLIYFHIKDLDTIYVTLGDKAKSIFDELSTIITSILRQSDLTTSPNNSLFLSVLVETSQEGANIAIQRLKTSISDLLENNLSMDIEVKGHAFPVTGEIEPTALIDKVVAHVNS